MGKVVPVLLLLMMGAHLIRPLGLPGLKKRKDFWKIAAVGLFVFGATVLLRPE